MRTSAPACALCRERLSVRTADGVSPDDVVLEQDLRFGVLDQLEHRGEGVGAVSQQTHAIGARERTPGHLGQPGLEPGIERPGGVETPGRLDRLERDRRPPFTRVSWPGPHIRQHCFRSARTRAARSGGDSVSSRSVHVCGTCGDSSAWCAAPLL